MKDRKVERLFMRLLMSKKYDVSVKKKKRKGHRSDSKSADKENEVEIEMKRTFSIGPPDAVLPKKESTVKNATREVFDDFCSETSIHGVKYLNQASCSSRAVWILIYAFALWFCGFLVLERYDRWDKNPVIISFDKKFESIAEVPFAAVTIW